MNTYNTAIYFDVPIDCFYIGQLEKKEFVYKSLIYKIFHNIPEKEEKFIYQYMKLYRESKL